MTVLNVIPGGSKAKRAEKNINLLAAKLYALQEQAVIESVCIRALADRERLLKRKDIASRCYIQYQGIYRRLSSTLLNRGFNLRTDCAIPEPGSYEQHAEIAKYLAGRFAELAELARASNELSIAWNSEYGARECESCAVSLTLMAKLTRSK